MSSKNKKSLGSDNHSGIHPEILKSLIEANQGHAHSYGLDPLTRQAEQVFKKTFGQSELNCFFVLNGTGCNVLALSGLTQSYESVLCADTSHINEDECAAPEVHGQLKLIPIKTSQGKICLDSISEHIVRRGDQHFAQPKVLSITQPTEFGTVYSASELTKVRALCDKYQLFLHIDGSRLAQAVSYLNLDFKSFYDLCRPDVISFGGTKNGLLFGEALLVFRPQLQNHYRFLRKQLMQLPSKGRFVAAQFNCYLQNQLWFEIAKHNHQMALYLANGLLSKGIHLEYPVQSNAVFVKMPKEKIKILKEKMFFYVWNETTFLSRLMCTFDTTKDDIDHFLSALDGPPGCK
jgi:threonine aldolase